LFFDRQAIPPFTEFVREVRLPRPCVIMYLSTYIVKGILPGRCLPIPDPPKEPRAPILVTISSWRGWETTNPNHPLSDSLIPLTSRSGPAAAAAPPQVLADNFPFFAHNGTGEMSPVYFVGYPPGPYPPAHTPPPPPFWSHLNEREKVTSRIVHFDPSVDRTYAFPSVELRRANSQRSVPPRWWWTWSND
jgi:hypothetical protein